MPYWVVILSPAIISPNGIPQHETANVVGPMSAVQFNQKYGDGAAHNGINPPKGFLTSAAAHAAATKFNSQSAAQRETPGSAPFAPNAAKVPAFHGLNLETWILRTGEIILGIVLIGVGIAKLTGTDNFIMKAATIAGKAAIL